MGQYGTKDGVSGFMYTTYIGNGDGSVAVGKKKEEESSLWESIWNSEIMRSYVLDVIGIHLSATLVPTIGAGYSYNFIFLTRGRDVGFHMSQSLSGRVGEEAGIGASFVSGNYQGRGQDATFDSLTGWGVDINGELGPVNIGVWGSINTTSKRASWIGTSVGTGWGIGGSAGVSYTWPIK